MFDWLGLSPELTQILGWIFIFLALALFSLLIWYLIILKKEIKKEKLLAQNVDNNQAKQENINVVQNTEKPLENAIIQPMQIENQIIQPMQIENEEVDLKNESVQTLTANETTQIKTYELPKKVLELKMPAKISENLRKANRKRKSSLKTIKKLKLEKENSEKIKRKRNNIKRSKTPQFISKIQEEIIINEKIIDPKQEESIDKKTSKLYIKKLKSLTSEQKKFYEQVKNYLCSYPAITNNIIKDSETFKLSRRVIARLKIKNSKLVLYLKLSKDELEKRFGANLPEYQQYEKAPMEFVFGDELELRKTLNLIESLAQEYEIDTSEKYKTLPFNKLINF